MKVSVCITVLNEEKSVGKLLDSLLRQTKKPSEIVIVDGGSKDKTVQIIKHYQKRDKRIKLVIEPGSCAHGRNVSIELAKNSIVALTDASCEAKKDWLEKLTEPFKHETVDFVAGFYHMITKTPMQKAISVYHGIPPKRFDPTSFLPSARSMAFRKKIWEKLGGFSEKLEKAGEDTLFNYKVLQLGARLVRVKDAIVYWEEPSTFTFKDSWQKFYQYAKGDAQAKIWWHPQQRVKTHNLKILTVFIRYILGFVLLILSTQRFYWLQVLLIGFALYLLWSIWKWRDVIKDWRTRIWLAVIQITSDFAVMGGFLSGMIKQEKK